MEKQPLWQVCLLYTSTITEEQQTKVKASQAITLLLGDDNKLYYYEGEPNYKDYTSLKETCLLYTSRCV